jgi:hypothetical protein
MRLRLRPPPESHDLVHPDHVAHAHCVLIAARDFESTMHMDAISIRTDLLRGLRGLLPHDRLRLDGQPLPSLHTLARHRADLRTRLHPLLRAKLRRGRHVAMRLRLRTPRDQVAVVQPNVDRVAHSQPHRVPPPDHTTVYDHRGHDSDGRADAFGLHSGTSGFAPSHFRSSG